MVIPVELSTAVTVAAGLAALAGTWRVMGYRLRALEGQIARLAEVEKRVGELDARIEFVRQSQGTRIGGLETKADTLAGELEGFRTGVAVGMRRRLRVVKGGSGA